MDNHGVAPTFHKIRAAMNRTMILADARLMRPTLHFKHGKWRPGCEWFTVLQTMTTVIYEIHLNSICSLPGYQNDGFAPVFRIFEGSTQRRPRNNAEHDTSRSRKRIAIEHHVRGHFALKVSVNPSADKQWNFNGGDIGTATRSVVREPLSAEFFRFLPREVLVARIHAPQAPTADREHCCLLRD